MRASLAGIDARADRERWSEERRENAKRWGQQHAVLNASLATERENEAQRSAFDVIDRLGARFVSPNQISANMSDTGRRNVAGIADANARRAPSRTARPRPACTSWRSINWRISCAWTCGGSGRRSARLSSPRSQVSMRADPQSPEALTHRQT